MQYHFLILLFMSVSLLEHNTLGLAQMCHRLLEISDRNTLIETCLEIYHSDNALLILGGGSNIVFLDDFYGTVVKVVTKGIEVVDDGDTVLITAQAGENWHEFVQYCVANGYYGIENLALIPGTVGAAPIQNIGAYGVELASICESVEFVDLDAAMLYEINNVDCQFGYRESIFKQQLKNKALITAVTFRLNKVFKPILTYAPLNTFDTDTVTAQMVFDEVCRVRQDKLPDPQVMGNVGSFFKNPIVSQGQYQQLVAKYPDSCCLSNG